MRWLSAWAIHNANHLRESRDGLKVGGRQASCASITAIMAALYFHALRPQDRVTVKPHAGPVLRAIHYLLGNQSLDQFQRYRGLGEAQSYPSRTKDKIPVDSVAVSIPGGLITPIVAGAASKSLSAIASEMKDLAGRARDGRLQPQEYQGGTASLSTSACSGLNSSLR